MDESMVQRRAWLRLPCRAVRVRATLDGWAEGDLLRETLLRLLRGRGFTLDELDEVLGRLGPDTIEAALERLALDLLVTRPATPVGAWTSATCVQSAPPPLIRGGWIVVSPHDGRPVPAVWLGGEPPRATPVSGLALEPAPMPETPPGDDRRIQKLLTELCAAKATIRVHGKETVAGKTTAAGQRGVSTARALLVDDYARRRWRKAVAWVPVSFLPRVSGDATFVVHRPQVEPVDPVEGSVDDALLEWIRTGYPAAWEALTAHARRLGDDSSIIRQLVGIQTEEEMDRIVDRHFATLARAYELPPRRGEHVNVEQQVRFAHRWLVIALRDPKFHQQARDAFGHAIELLCDVLARFEREWLPPLLERIVTEDDGRRVAKELGRRLEDRLREFGLKGRLSESEKYLRVAKPKEVLREIDARRIGAGAALTVWLLPLVVAEEQDAAEFAQQIRRMLQREPQLFELLDTLVQVRNDVFHQARDSRLPPFVQQPDRVDEYLFRAWSAILHGDVFSEQGRAIPKRPALQTVAAPVS
jgi:hypothetical protein